MAISEGKHGNFGGQSRKEGEGSGFAAGVVILTLSGLLVKLFGLFYKIPLVQLLGDSRGAYSIRRIRSIPFSIPCPQRVCRWRFPFWCPGGGQKGNSVRRSGCFGTVCWQFFPGSVLQEALFCSCLRRFLPPLSAIPARRAVLRRFHRCCCFPVCPASCGGIFRGVNHDAHRRFLGGGSGRQAIVAGLLLALYALHRGYGMERAAAYADFRG